MAMIVGNFAYGFFLGLILTYPLSIIIQNWFENNQGLALGITMTGSGVAGIILNPISSYVIENFGWRNGILCLSIISLLLLIPCVLIILAWTPKQKGMDAYKKETVKTELNNEGNHPELLGLAVIVGVLFYILSAYNQSIALYIASLGLSVSFAGMFSSVSMLGNVLGKVFIGLLADRFGSIRVAICTVAGVIISFIILIFVEVEVFMLIAALLYGMIMSVCAVMPGMFSKELSPPLYRKELISKTTAYGTFGSAIYLLVINYSYDYFASFKPIFMLSIVFTLIAIGILFYIEKKKSS